MSTSISFQDAISIKTEVKHLYAEGSGAFDTVKIEAVSHKGEQFSVSFFMKSGASDNIGAITMPAIPTAPKPFSTYPEDRAKMLALCAGITSALTDEDACQAAIELADLVKAVLSDEAVL